MAGLYVKDEYFRFLAGKERLTKYAAPILRNPPPYEVWFCSRCGAVVPTPAHEGEWYIAAGLLDDDPGMKPDRHIFVELKAPWFEITGDTPQFDIPTLREFRSRTRPSDD